MLKTTLPQRIRSVAKNIYNLFLLEEMSQQIKSIPQTVKSFFVNIAQITWKIANIVLFLGSKA